MSTAKEQADALLQQALQLNDPELALALYHQALALDPESATVHYNVGLIHKYRGEWDLSRHHNRRSVELRPDDQAANWNLAIAATALRDWATAREVWHRLGVITDAGEGPIEADFGMTPVRLNPEGEAEVVWGHRMDPVRVRIENIPYPTSGYRYNDVVLHDGAPMGTRHHKDVEYSVFNVLEMFQASRWSTYEVEVRVSRNGDEKELEGALDAAQVTWQNWTTSTRLLCKQCSEGRPHADHDRGLADERHDRHVFGLALEDTALAKQVLKGWTNRRRKLLRFQLKLNPPSQH